MSRREMPVRVGQKIQMPGGDTTNLAPIVDGVQRVVDSYNHRASRFLDIDYMVDEEGYMQVHIYPRIPDHRQFYPDDQTFARAVETATTRILGRGAEIEAEFHELDGVHSVFREDGTERQVKTDTRVLAYYRTPEGTVGSIKFKDPVPKVWFRVVSVPGMMYPKERAIEMIVEALIAETENLVPRA